MVRADSLNLVDARELSLAGVWEFTPVLRGDDRGMFLESFKSSVFAPVVGHALELRQMNVSMSRVGTVRGVHFADVPPGQAKYVQCFSGRILDIVVDIRVGSPTFGSHDAVELSDITRTGLYIPEGFGHAFCALTESATVGYLCSEEYAPDREHGIHPLDPELALPWPEIASPVLSPKDAQAPTLAAAIDSGLLPSYARCVEYMADPHKFDR